MQGDVISPWGWLGPWQIADVRGCKGTSSHHGDGSDLGKSQTLGVARGCHLTMVVARTLKVNRGRYKVHEDVMNGFKTEHNNL